MANLTIAIADALLQRAREASVREHTSVNALAREFRPRHVDARSQPQHQLSWFDALIAEGATRSGCSLLDSEDFHHGSQLGGPQVIHPLAA